MTAKAFFLAALIATAMPAIAQQSAVCKQLDAEITLAEQNMASHFADGITDNSAPRETNRQLRVGNEWASVQTHITLMAANKCTPISRPITARSYMGSALTCATARIKGETSPSSCARSEWKAAAPKANE